MRILMTSETYLPRVGGAEVHVENLFSILQKKGDQVVLLTNEKGKDCDGVIRVSWSKKALFKILKILWKEGKKAEIIHSHYCHRLAFLSAFVGKVRRKPVIITLHGMGILDQPNVSKLNHLKHSFYRYFSLKLCTHVISTSEDLAVVAKKYISQKKISIIPNGYDSEKFKPDFAGDVKQNLNLDKNKKIIVTVRRLVPKNGIHYLVEALPYIIEKEDDIHYIVVGDGSMRHHLERRCNELGLNKYISFVGMVDNDEVVKYLSVADVVVFPSTAESSSIACAEAMGLEKIIVSSRVGGLVELLGENNERGLLVDLVPWTGSNYDAPMSLPAERYRYLADGVIDGLQVSVENENRKKEALKYAQTELSWTAIFNKTKNIYLMVTKV